jgi:hypothetical protein
MVNPFYRPGDVNVGEEHAVASRCYDFLSNQQPAMVNGQWSMVNGQWPMANGQWSTVNPFYCLGDVNVEEEHAVARRRYDFVSNQRPAMVNGQWSMFNGQRPMANGQWSTLFTVQATSTSEKSTM